MRQAYTIGVRQWKERKAKCKNKRDKGACLGPVHIGDRVVKVEVFIKTWIFIRQWIAKEKIAWCMKDS